MLKNVFRIVKKIVLGALLIYSFNVFAVSLNLSIPINFFTLLIVSFFDFSGLLGLILFSFLF